MVNSTRMSTNSETAMLSNKTFYIETRPHLLINIYGYHIYGRCNIGGLQYLGACSADQSATGLTALDACSASTFRFPLSLPVHQPGCKHRPHWTCWFNSTPTSSTSPSSRTWSWPWSSWCCQVDCWQWPVCKWPVCPSILLRPLLTFPQRHHHHHHQYCHKCKHTNEKQRKYDKKLSQLYGSGRSSS